MATVEALSAKEFSGDYLRAEVKEDNPAARYPIPELLLFFNVTACEHHDTVRNCYERKETSCSTGWPS